ncbi:gdp-d-mannose pyrophosphorylase [Cystoisospora suis]|uniref:mannose-1-phosphate guanylyltransferase n=1 Tax=Cystoisospora suis TaxID=483139 RepID=A0A2C6L7H0_9APIC|nr:gdp-d-mannose pyrophosphorylase [Cystoisospora suis]
MKALVLVGGYGTRLRPLTLSVPKPLINFCNKSIVEYQIQSLKQAGVDHLILAVAYQPSAMMEALSELEKKYDIKITCSREEEPLGTAGPIRLAKPLLLSPSPLLVKSSSSSTSSSLHVDAALDSQEGSRETPPPSSPEGEEREKDTQEGGGEEEKSNKEHEEKREMKDRCFFVCNSDVICDFPLKEMLAFHKRKKAEATILVTEVEDPSQYGVVLHEEEEGGEGGGKILRFVEKPQTYVGNCINAGLYILNASVIDRIPLSPTSIEKEIFPSLAKKGSLFCYKLKGYWADIGRPKDFLEGMSLHLNALRTKQEEEEKQQKKTKSHGEKEKKEEGENPLKTLEVEKKKKHEDRDEKESFLLSSPRLVEGPQFIGNVLVDPTAKIGEDCLIGPDVTIDRGVTIGRGCRLKHTAIMTGVRIDDFSWIQSSILGWQSKIGKWCRIEGLTVVGEDVQIAGECFINGAFILPHKHLTQSIHEPGAIIM